MTTIWCFLAINYEPSNALKTRLFWKTTKKLRIYALLEMPATNLRINTHAFDSCIMHIDFVEKKFRKIHKNHFHLWSQNPGLSVKFNEKLQKNCLERDKDSRLHTEKWTLRGSFINHVDSWGGVRQMTLF